MESGLYDVVQFPFSYLASEKDEALVQLSKQQVPHIVARAVRRNASAMKFFKRSGFDWVRTEEYLLGRDM